MIRINDTKLAKFKLQGMIASPLGYGWELTHEGRSLSLPSVGGITLNFKVGDLANRYVADHLEPSVSTVFEHDKRNDRRNVGYNTFSCIGNDATVVSGKAKGKKGVVTGHHGGVEHVIIDFDDKTLDSLTYDDKIMITAHGLGLEIADIPDITLLALDPRLLKKMNLKITKGKLEVPVTRMVPAVVMGSGLGHNFPYQGDYDIQTSDSETTKEYGLDQLKLGDIVAITDHDSRYGWSYKQGAISIGVIIHGDSKIAGHGPGCQTIMTCITGNIVPKISSHANIGYYLGIGRYRR